MKLRCERDVLVEALGTAGRAVAGRGGERPVLSGVRMEVTGDRLHVAGSDLDLTIQVDVSVSGSSDGVCVVPARLAANIVRAMEPGAVTIEAGEDEVRIASGRSHFAVRVLPAAEFPRLPASAADGGVTLDAGELEEALRQVVRAASGDDTRPILTGVLMTAEESTLRLVATDGYRLAVRNLAGNTVLREGQKVLVPSKALTELQRLLAAAEQVTLHLGEHDAGFEVGNVRLTTRLIEGEFPNYRQLIPERIGNRVVVARGPLLDAVRRVRLLTPDPLSPVWLTLGAGRVAVTAVTNDVGSATEEVDADYEGEDMTVAYNPTFLMSGLDAIVGEAVVFDAVDKVRAALLSSCDSDDYVYVLMPVQRPAPMTPEPMGRVPVGSSA